MAALEEKFQEGATDRRRAQMLGFAQVCSIRVEIGAQCRADMIR